MHMINRMEFTCNSEKNAINARERQLPLLAARIMFDAAMLVREDTRRTYPERRFVGYNTIEGRWMVVVFCCPAPELRRIIFFRKANDRERKKFEAQSL